MASTAQNQSGTVPAASSTPPQPQDQSEEINKRLNVIFNPNGHRCDELLTNFLYFKGLRPSESLLNRLKSFEELIKLGELFNLNEVYGHVLAV